MLNWISRDDSPTRCGITTPEEGRRKGVHLIEREDTGERMREDEEERERMREKEIGMCSLVDVLLV